MAALEAEGTAMVVAAAVSIDIMKAGKGMITIDGVGRAGGGNDEGTGSRTRGGYRTIYI